MLEFILGTVGYFLGAALAHAIEDGQEAHRMARNTLTILAADPLLSRLLTKAPTEAPSPPTGATEPPS